MRVKQPTPAFTLIELLVVVAITALLMAMLIPALTAARSQARETRCRTQLREYGRGFHFYLTEFRDIFPAADYGPFGNTILRPTWFELVDKYWITNTRESSVAQAEEGRRMQLARCPDLTQPRENNNMIWEWDYSWQTLGYGYNRYWLGWNQFNGNPTNPPPINPATIAKPNFWCRLAKVKNAAECLMVGDSLVRELGNFPNVPPAGHYLGWAAMVRTGAGVDTRHGAKYDTPTVMSTYGGDTAWYYDGRGNICWVDGHVAARPSEQINKVFEWRRLWDPEQGVGGYLP
jgi:prepilin-type processing-associated H-X9-DG protein/prepilin-type N-terminal cleavage/methylation domain-containing protein